MTVGVWVFLERAVFVALAGGVLGSSSSSGSTSPDGRLRFPPFPPPTGVAACASAWAGVGQSFFLTSHHLLVTDLGLMLRTLEIWATSI